jgi:HSP20 family molecular chaperone IbpA
MRAMNRWEQPLRGAATLQDQINRMFNEGVGHAGQESNLTPWAPAVDIYETENELVIKADLPDVQNGVLTLSLPKREETKPKQIKVNVGTHAMAAAAGAR